MLLRRLLAVKSIKYHKKKKGGGTRHTKKREGERTVVQSLEMHVLH